MRELLRQRPLKVRLQHAVRDINTTVLVENDIDVQKLRKIKFRPSRSFEIILILILFFYCSQIYQFII